MKSDRGARSLLDRATAWSPVLLLGGLAALTYWLDAQVQPPAPRRDGTERHDPDIYIEGFRAVELDANGRPRQLIAGKRALHYGDDQTTEIVEPMLSQTEAGVAGLRRRMRAETPGRCSYEGTELAVPGHWTARVEVLVSDFEQVAVELGFDIASTR